MRKIWWLGSVLLLVVSVSWAQHIDPRGDEASRNYVRHRNEVFGQVHQLLLTARTSLLQKKFAQVFDDCERARVLLSEFSDVFAYELHELLAETYYAKGSYVSARQETFLPRDVTPTSRLAMTQAMCLVKTGETESASRIIWAVIGTASSPERVRKVHDLWELPIDRGNSPTYLLSTALILRTMCDTGPTIPDESKEADLLTAAKLAPRSASANLAIGKWLFNHKKGAEAKPFLEAARERGKDKRTVARADFFLEKLKRGN
jgi:hypothetical protein